MKPTRAFGVLLCILMWPISVPGVHADEPLRIGMAEADITPPLGFPMAGYYHERLATGTRDPLKARAIVFRGNGDQAALVVCDLAGIAADLTAEVRKRAAQKTGLPAGNIVLTATHSHTAPDYTKDLYEHLRPGAAHGPRRRDAARLIDGIVDAIATAHAKARPAVVQSGSARQETPVSFNRRFVMKDGSVRTWMRLDHPEVVRAAGPIDPEVGLALIRSADRGQAIGLLSNFALHLDTVGGLHWSADYPFYIEQALRKDLGKDVISVFGTGCCGDINHVDPVARERNKTEVIDQALATTVAKGLANLREIKSPKLRVRRATVSVQLQKVSPEEVAKARPLILEARAGKSIDFFKLVAAYKAVVLDHLRNKSPSVKASDLIGWGLSHTWAGVGERLPVEVHAICLGDDLAIVCLPGEIFVELGLAIKRVSPFKTTLVIELSNCKETLYVPTRTACVGGGYEVLNSAVEPGAGELLAATAIRLLREAADKGRTKEKP